MSIEVDQIKKLRVRYLKCTKGGLHDGEVLNFMCIDPNCKEKGLICPVCQNTTHNKHETLHLKIFLNEISKNLFNQQESTELSGLSQYLVSLDNSKKDMIKGLKSVVQQLANKVKEIQGKIEEGYRKIRRAVLSQSTISMRLPQLYRLLTDKEVQMDETEVYRQIGRYSELLQYKEGKIITVDSVKNLVDEYSSKAGTLNAQLLAVVDQTAKIFNSLPLDVNKFGAKAQVKKVKTQAIFSSTSKSSGIEIKNEKEVVLGQDVTGGLAFIETENAEEKKVSLKIADSPSSGAFTIGVANLQKFKEKAFQINYEGQAGLYGMLSFGIFPQELEGEAFPFSVGDTIDLTWNTKNQKLSFARRHGVEKSDIIVPINAEQAKKCSFFVTLTGPGDSVTIVE